MSVSESATLEAVIRDAGEDRLIDEHEPRSEAMSRVLRLLREARELAAARNLGGAAPLDESAIVREYSRNPSHVKAFLQALQVTSTPEMLLMVWRILQGMEIQSIHVHYQARTIFEMRVVLQSPYEDGDERYESCAGDDLLLLRHIGAFEIDGKPVFDGFYAQR